MERTRPGSRDRGAGGVRGGAAILAATAAVTAVMIGLWPGSAGAEPGRPTLRVTPARERLHRVSPPVREAVGVIDSDDDADDRAAALWAMYMAVRGDGEAALIRWALELQSVVRARKGNYLHALCWVLNQSSTSWARRFAEGLARRGIAIGPNTGHYERLDHLDPAAPIPELPARVGNTPVGRYVDAFAVVRYDLSYRPDKKGQLSKLLQVVYDDGAALDIDIRLISDDYDPASNQSLGRMHLGVAGRLYPLRMDRLSTPRLWAAKQAALAEMRRYNQAFEELVTISIGGVMVPLELAIPVQQPATGAVRSRAGRAAKAPRSTRPAAAVRPAPRIGHSTPWSRMTARQRRAFQHSYSRHAKELGLPRWSQKNAPALQRRFNNVVGHIRAHGQLRTGMRKPFNGRSVGVNYWEAPINGHRYYYYETLDGQFISAGRVR